MAVTIFDIPHIFDSITKDLTYWELYNCALVSKHWNCVFSPILWKELYTYYSNPECCEYWNYSCYFTTLESRNALLRNCADVRTLKVRNNNVLRILRGTTCINLVEIHYTADVDVSGDLGLDSLMDLMECNPNIRALALRKIKIGEERLDQEVKEFLKFLCLYSPSLTSIDIQFEGKNSYKMEAYIILNLLKYKQNVTIQSIDNCKKESASKIQKMVREVHQLINDYGEEPFEVRNLSLQLPSIHAESSVVLALMKRCSKIQSFRLDYTTRFLDGWLGGVDFEALSAESLSRIQYISGSPTFSDSIWGSIIKTCQPLVSLDLSTDLSPSISQALSGHIASLRHLSFTSIGCRRLNLSVLASLPNLETFHGIYLLSGPSDIMAMPDWTCLGLKKLHIGIRLDDRSRRPIQVTEDTLESWIMGISEARHRLLEQIGRLTHLQSLNIFESDISYYDNMRDRISPTIANTASGHGISYMGLGHGLELLRDLEDLVDVTMDGVFETFTRNSIEWMTEHWPKLEKLTQLVHPLDPMPTEMLSKLESNDVTKDSGWMSELKRRRPKLNIKITTEEDGVRDHCDFCGDELNIYEESQDESFLNQIGLYEEDVARYI